LTPKPSSEMYTRPKYTDIALVAVTHNPSERCVQNIADASGQFCKCFVADNSGPHSRALSRLHKVPHIEIIANIENLGLAMALNQLASLALERGFDWIVTIDQDTRLLPDFLQEMLSSKKIYPANLAAVGCDYRRDTKARPRFKTSSHPLFKEKATVITSGCLTNLSAWRTIGGFNSDFFIDAIDHEFCLRLRKAGFAVGFTSKVLMHHGIGENVDSKFRSHFVFPHQHPPWRNYTSARNTTYTIRQHFPREAQWCFKRCLSLTLELAAILVFADRKIERTRAYFNGIRHGWRGKLEGVAI